LSKIIGTAFGDGRVVPFRIKGWERNDAALTVNASLASPEACG
jgi:hypothetical protein